MSNDLEFLWWIWKFEHPNLRNLAISIPTLFGGRWKGLNSDGIDDNNNMTHILNKFVLAVGTYVLVSEISSG